MRRILLAPTLIATVAVLAGCGSGTDEKPDTAPGKGSEPSLADSPLMACYGLVGLEELQNCVPGVGSMSARDVKIQLPEHAEVDLGNYNQKREAPSATLEIDNRWLRAFLVPYKVASHGLTPEMIGARVEVYDLADQSAVASIDLPNAKVDAILPDVENNLFIAALTDTDVPGYTDRRDEITATMAAVDPLAGKTLWQKDDLLTSNPHAVIDRGILPVFGTPKEECGSKTIARTVQVIDTGTGDLAWTTHVTELRGPRDNDQCTADVVYADPALPYIQVTREGDLPYPPDPNYALTTNLDVKTGNVFAPLPSEVVDFGNTRDYFADREGPLAAVRITRDGHYGRQGGETGWLIVDRESGTIVNRIPSGMLSQVNAQIVGMYDSKLILKNATTFAVDARTTADAGSVKSQPIRDINGWTLDANGTFTEK